jgi:hypothetical protein
MFVITGSKSTTVSPYNKVVLSMSIRSHRETLSHSQPLMTRRGPQVRILNLGLGLPFHLPRCKLDISLTTQFRQLPFIPLFLQFPE